MSSAAYLRTPVAQITAEDAMKMLSERWEKRGSVREAFLSISRSGVISPSELKAVVDSLGVSINGPEFRKLWRMFDSSGEGRLTHAAFNRVVGPLIFPSSWGISSTMNRPTTPPLTTNGETLLGYSLRSKVHDIEAVWKELDIYNSGRIRHPELIQGLRMLGIRMKDESIFALMKRFASPTNTSAEITREEFGAIMRYLLNDVPSPREALDAEAEAAALRAAEEEVSRVLPGTKHQVLGALAPFDLAGTGVISHEDFRGMLEELGARGLTPHQYDSLALKYDDLGDGTIDLRNFAGRFVAEHSRPDGARQEERGVGDSSYYTPGELDDGEGALGMGGKSAIALIKKNTEGSYPGIFSSRKTYPPWFSVGVRPVIDPLTHQPMVLDKLSRLAMSRTGMSEGESRVVLCLVGRRRELVEACERRDTQGTGMLSRRAFMDILGAFDVDVDPSTMDLLSYRFDPAHTGKVLNYGEFIKAIGRILDAPYHPTSAKLALAQVGLEAIPGFVHEHRQPGASSRTYSGSPSSTASALALAMSPSPLALAAPAFSSSSSSSPRDAAAAASDSWGGGGGGGGGGGRVVIHEAGEGHNGEHSFSYAASDTSSSSAAAAAAAAALGDVEAVVSRLRGALSRKWANVGKVIAAELDNATSPLLQAGRAGVSAEFSSPLRLNLGGGGVGGGGAGSGAGSSKKLIGFSSKNVVPTSPLENTLKLGSSVRGGGGGGFHSPLGSSSSSSAPHSARGALKRVPLPLFQRALAQQGFAITPRELRALSARYGNNGSTEGPAVVDFEQIVRDAGM